MAKRLGVGVVGAGFVGTFHIKSFVGVRHADILEKQTAEQGLMPVVADEPGEYGYTDENRHRVDCFPNRKTPTETFEDGSR